MRSLEPDALAGNLGYDGTVWFINVTLCQNNGTTTNQLDGTTSLQIPKSGDVGFTDLSLLYVSDGEMLCFSVMTSPYDAENANLTAKSESFSVKGKPVKRFGKEKLM